MPPPQSRALAVPGEDKAEPAKPGLVEYMIEGVKERVPELAANAAATKANHSPSGLAFWRVVKAPLSLVGSLVCAGISALTRGQGPIGEWATRFAVGTAHATVAELSRPSQPENGAAASSSLSAPPGEAEASAP